MNTNHTGLTSHACLGKSDSTKMQNTRYCLENYYIVLLIRFSFTLKYFSELSINSVSKNKTDNSHLAFRCSWVRVFVHVLLYFLNI